jgi:hypothetical protein
VRDEPQDDAEGEQSTGVGDVVASSTSLSMISAMQQPTPRIGSTVGAWKWRCSTG